MSVRRWSVQSRPGETTGFPASPDSPTTPANRPTAVLPFLEAPMRTSLKGGRPSRTRLREERADMAALIAAGATLLDVVTQLGTPWERAVRVSSEQQFVTLVDGLRDGTLRSPVRVDVVTERKQAA